MLETLVITDLTQMKEPQHVCLVGISRSGECLRPVDEVRERGIPEGLLFQGSTFLGRRKAIAFPSAKVELDLHQLPVELPHQEDRGFDPASIRSQGHCTDAEWEDALHKGSFATMDQIFNGKVEYNKFVMPGANTRSIGTLTRPQITGLQITPRSAKPRLQFKDATGQLLDLPVSDKTLWDLCYKAVKKENRDSAVVIEDLRNRWLKADRIYLRLGLARPFDQDGTTAPRCYIQVTGLYTFPDYLNGKTWADFHKW